ncbi:hypothetical protein [Neomegalonema sp.]|uniref:hypothetical protein n=1 Tax=Neomegalonema sp. TaxID=2039713 RepID=UPI00262F0084|nr:hypothetical protein [Neomegalonema sp.]MDD2869658.1 hypothetical protein [Neomegalonema sp.]
MAMDLVFCETCEYYKDMIKEKPQVIPKPSAKDVKKKKPFHYKWEHRTYEYEYYEQDRGFAVAHYCTLNKTQEMTTENNPIRQINVYKFKVNDPMVKNRNNDCKDYKKRGEA